MDESFPGKSSEPQSLLLLQPTGHRDIPAARVLVSVVKLCALARPLARAEPNLAPCLHFILELMIG